MGGHIVDHITSPEDLANLPKTYKTIPGLKSNELTYYILLIKEDVDLMEVLRKIGGRYYKEDQISFKIIEDNDDQAIVSCKINLGEENIVKGIFSWDKESNLLYVLTDYGNKRKILKSFLYKLYPLIKMASISSNQIIIPIINSFLEKGYIVTSSMVSEKKWWEKEEKMRSSLEYPTDIPIADVIQEISRKKAFINSIAMNILNKQGLRVCKFFISRKGKLKYNDGSFEIFKEFVLDKVTDFINGNYEGLKNREQVGETIKPLIINFSINKDPKRMIKEFINVLRTNQEISLMTHHNGNPFFYADVSDIKEGSSFGVMFESKRELSKMTLIPQEISSPLALSNFLSYVFNRFGEGEITYQNG